LNGRCQHTHTHTHHHHPPHPLNQPCSRTMIPLPPFLPPPPLPSPFCSALNRCEPSEGSKTAPWSSRCSSTRVHKELVWSSVERMQGLHSPVERKQCGQGTMQKVSTTPPTHPPTPTACLLHLHAQRVDLPVLSPGSVSLPHSQKRVLGLFVPHGQPGGARRHSSPSAVAIRVKYLHCKQRHQQCGKRRRVDTS
jgi:hypothetical protein